MKNNWFWLLLIVFSGSLFSCGNQSANTKNTELIIFHAGSLSVPLKMITHEFEKENPGTKVLLESAGSVACARKITDLKKDCDIMASADYDVIDRFLIPEYADWNISFAANEMVIGFTDKSRMKDQINSENWYEILQNEKVAYGRSEPNSDPCGYRSVMTTQLEALRKKDQSILHLLEKDQNFIRPKEVDLLGLLESNAIDYIFIYKSVAKQHQLHYVTLSDSINLSNPKLGDWYAYAKVDIAGKAPDETIQLEGKTMVYGITQIKNAPNPELAAAFLEFFFDPEKGMKIIEEQGQTNILPSFSATYNRIPKNLQKQALEIK
ncbi:MAG: tungstate ABC transporter substrate-binding protein WtpA [Bacteroidales bacterium]|nr:tungstate ABC transporter substrate-binding protein WtpA [Bacteroidales bacterium]